MRLTECLAIDIECVGRQDGQSMAARVSMVNEYLEPIMDTYVFPTHPVADYRTFVSGVKPHHLKRAPDFAEVREKVRGMIKGRIVVGHGLHHDFKALRLSHPDWNKRDSSTFPTFIWMNGNKQPSLRWLALKVLNKHIQEGQHNPVQDASAAMQLYRAYREEWEDWNAQEYYDDSSSSSSEYYDSSSSDD